MNIGTYASGLEEYVISSRRWLHQHPELSWQEQETTAYVEDQLRQMGLEPHRFEEGGTGLWTLIPGGKATPSTKTVMLRADIDALPVEEHTGAPYASQNQGVMHACGHDCHVAMLLGAAKILTQVQGELPGTVKLVFQPAEEAIAGARYCVRHGALEGVDAVYGCHVNSFLDAPYISVDPGPRHASADEFTIQIHGVSAHGSAPHCGKDAIAAAAAVILDLQLLVSRLNDPMEPLVVTIGTIQGGERLNIIAKDVKMSGSVRTFSKELRAQMPEQIRKVAQAAASVLGCTAEVEYRFGTGPIVHDDPSLVEIGRAAVEKLYGAEGLRSLPPVTGSDDFAEFMETVPGLFPSIGIRNEKLGCVYNHHNDHFCVDESALVRGAALYAQFAIDYLISQSK